MKVVDFDELRDAVQDAWNDQYTIDSLNRVLVRYEFAIATPLLQQAPDSASRSAIQSQKVRLPGETSDITLTPDVVQWVLEFSDATELNELDVLKLLVQAFRMAHDDPRRGETEKETALNLYFNQRSSLLVALLDIVQMVNVSNEFDPRLVRITQSYVQRLREKGLVTNLIDRIKGLLRVKCSSYRSLFDSEIRQLALVLFYLQQSVGLDIQHTSSDLPNVKAVIQLADEISRHIPKSIRESPDKQEMVAHAQSLTTTVYILIMTVVKVMIHPPVGDVSSRVHFPQWSDCAGSPLRCSYNIVWSLSTSSPPQVLIDAVLEGGAGFHAFLQRSHDLTKKTRLDLAEVAADFMLELLNQHLDTLKFTPSDPGRVLSVLGKNFQIICEIAPDIAYTFWASRAFTEFLLALDALTPLTSSRFSSYVALIASLCHGEAAHRAFAFVASAKNTNWHRVFDIFQRSVRDTDSPATSAPSHRFSGPLAPTIETAPASSLPPMDIQILCDLLALVRAMASAPSSANSLALQHLAALDTLFTMLACSFPVRLKAAIVSCLHSWAEGRPSDVSLLWERIEAAQMLQTTSFSASPKALLHDLEVVESRDGCYPLTLSFLKLLEAMVSSAPVSLLSRLGSPGRRGGPLPYVHFVRDHVVIKGVSRRYVSDHHRFEVLGAGLRVLNAFAACEHEDSTSEVLTPLMSRQQSSLNAVSAVLAASSVALDASSDTSAASEALSQALCLLATGCAAEERLSAFMARQSLESTPLSTLLLRRSESVVHICESVSRQSPSLQLYGSRVLLALALRDGSLIVRVLSQHQQLDRVRSSLAAQLRGLHAACAEEMASKKAFAATILHLLVETLRAPYPTMSHVLLGFGSTTSATGETRVEQGGNGCLVALLHLVRKPCFMRVFPHLAQLSLRLFYRLLEDPRTSRAFLSYLALHDDVFSTCLRSLPLLHQPLHDDRYHYLLQLAWLLKALALQQHLRRSFAPLESTGSSPLHLLGLQGTGPDESGRLMMTEVLEAIRPQLSGDLPAFGGLDRGVCVHIGKDALIACVERVGDAVLYEEGSLDSAVAPSRGSDEFLWRLDALYGAAASAGLDGDAVVRSASAFNENVKVLAASRAALEGWKQVIQVWLYQREPAELELDLELSLLSALLDKLQEPVWRPVVVSLSALALSLMAHIRINAPLLAGQPPYRLDHRILQKTLAGVAASTSHIARAHLYGVFYTFTEFTRELDLQRPSSQSAESAPRTGHDYALTQALHELNLSPAHLLKRACADAFDGASSSRALTLLFICSFPLDVALPILDRSSQVLRFVRALGARNDDVSLSAALTDAPMYYHVVLAFESHALLLLHLARHQAGARALFAADVLGRIFDAGFIDSRPPTSSAVEPSALHKYHQMLLPCLGIVQALLVAMPHRHDLHERVLALLLSQRDEGSHRLAFLETLRAPDVASPPMFALEALKAGASILLLLCKGPLYDRPELCTAINVLLARLPELGFRFRQCNSSSWRRQGISEVRLEQRRQLHSEVLREVLSLALSLVQRRQYVFEANLDPKVIRDDAAPSLPVDQSVPLGVVVYYAVEGGLDLLKWCAEDRSRLEECLDDVLRHRSVQRLPVDLVTALQLPANLSEPQQAALARRYLNQRLQVANAGHCLGVTVVQQSVQIVFLSLQLFFSSRGPEADLLRRHLDRLKESLDHVDTGFSGKQQDELISKQLRHCRYQLDAFEPVTKSTPTQPQLQYHS